MEKVNKAKNWLPKMTNKIAKGLTRLSKKWQRQTKQFRTENRPYYRCDKILRDNKRIFRTTLCQQSWKLRWSRQISNWENLLTHTGNRTPKQSYKH